MAKSLRPTSTDDVLREAHGLVDKITSFLSFSFIAGYALSVHRIRDGIDFSSLSPQSAHILAANTSKFVDEMLLPLLLALVTLIWLLRYKAASRNEIGILIRCFSSSIPLPEWKKLHGSRITRLLARGLTLVFLLLAFLVVRIELYAMAVYIWAIGDLLGNSAIQRNILMLFGDPRYIPPPDDPLRDIVLRRRAVAIGYWVERPQLVRITIFLAVIGGAVLLLGSTYATDVPFRREAAYVLVMLAILVNTTTMGVWRHARDIDLRNIEADEMDLKESRVQN